MDRKECENACLYLLSHCYEEKLIEGDIYEFTPSGFNECEIFKKLIEEHFELNNTAEFNHFKLYANSTLKAMTKDELIDYIHLLHHNWAVSDERAENIKEYGEKLQEKVNEWVPVEKGLPNEKEKDGEMFSDDVLVTIKGCKKDEYYVSEDCTIYGKWGIELTTGNYKVTAWMPKPEPYRGEEK